MKLNLQGIIGDSPALKEVFKILAKVAPTDSTVLVSGESGTGKELMVRALHQNSPRADKPFVPINCGAIPRELLESELFGHEKGAFTHAIRSRAGRFEMAGGGTVFLDEIGEMDLSLQVKILRVIQEREFERVGGSKTMKVDVRLVAATNRNLEEEVAKGTFREDLFYRLNVIPVHLPPLRDRGQDIIFLTKHFLTRFCERRDREPLAISPEAMEMLLVYSWPGNVRELENFMERMSILCDHSEIRPQDLPEKVWQDVRQGEERPRPVVQEVPTFMWPNVEIMRENEMNLKDFLDKIEENLLLEALEQTGGVKNQAAELLGIKRTTLIEKLKKRKIT
ncbi:MAG: sigma-54 interaction domain-containing protein [Desulfovibrionales bacterium]